MSCPPWVRGVSIPGALFGMLAFFLPWVAVSCGPLRMTASGYELATGQWSEKLSNQNISSFSNRTNNQNVPLLWIAPSACLILFVLGVAGMPRVPAILVSALGAAYLAYFGVTSEQQLNDPAITAGILGHEWLFGFWASWVGLLAPLFTAIFRPDRDERRSRGISEATNNGDE